MLIHRRTFVLGTAFVASAAPLMSVLIAPGAQATPASQLTPAAKPTGPGAPALGVRGWDAEQGDFHAWISVNQAWRVTWR